MSDSLISSLQNDLDVIFHSRGNELLLEGEEESVLMAQEALENVYHKILSKHEDVFDSVLSVEAPVVRNLDQDINSNDRNTIKTKRKVIKPRTANQAHFIDAINKHELTFGLGPAGTGKTYLAVAVGVMKLVAGEVRRLVFSRPAVEAGEKLGFLPGDMKDKVDPYLRPMYDALYDMLTPEDVARRMAANEIEVAPLAFMRGRTLAESFVVLDEAQNTTIPQMKMFLTRLGPHSRMVITGDMSQIDLPKGIQSGLVDASRVLEKVKGIRMVTFGDEDIVRHPLVTKIVAAYDKDTLDKQRSPLNAV